MPSRLGLEDEDIWRPSIPEYDLEDDPYLEEPVQQVRDQRPEADPPRVERPRRERPRARVQPDPLPAAPSPEPPTGPDPRASDELDLLESTLKQFLSSAADPAPVVEEVEASEQPANDPGGLYLDNLDFSRREPPQRAAQPQPIAEDFLDLGSAFEVPQIPASPALPSNGAADEPGDELLGQLRDSLAGLDFDLTAPADVVEGVPSVRPPLLPDDLITGLERAQPEMLPEIPEAPQSMTLNDSYTGILRIVFKPAADPTTLSFFWDILDSVAGVGKVVAETPLPDGSGHEFTLDLGRDVLETEQLMARIPGAEVEVLGPDRLGIHLAPMVD